MEVKLPAANKGFASGGSNVPVRHFFVYLSFVARSEFSSKNPARTQSPKTLATIIEEKTKKPRSAPSLLIWFTAYCDFLLDNLQKRMYLS